MWQKPVYEVSLVHREKDTFASIILGPDDKALGIYFYTPLKGGDSIYPSRFTQPSDGKAGDIGKKHPEWRDNDHVCFA